MTNSSRWVSNKGRRGRSESFINTLLILKFALVLPHKTECWGRADDKRFKVDFIRLGTCSLIQPFWWILSDWLACLRFDQIIRFYQLSWLRFALTCHTFSRSLQPHLWLLSIWSELNWDLQNEVFVLFLEKRASPLFMENISHFYFSVGFLEPILNITEFGALTIVIFWRQAMLIDCYFQVQSTKSVQWCDDEICAKLVSESEML